MEGKGNGDQGRVREEPVSTLNWCNTARVLERHFLCSDVQDPRALADIFAKAEADLAARLHPDPYRGEQVYLMSFGCSLTAGCPNEKHQRHLMVPNGMYLFIVTRLV